MEVQPHRGGGSTGTTERDGRKLSAGERVPAGRGPHTGRDGGAGGTAGRSANSPSGPSPWHCRTCHPITHFNSATEPASATGTGAGGEVVAVAVCLARHFGQVAGSGSGSGQQHAP